MDGINYIVMKYKIVKWDTYPKGCPAKTNIWIITSFKFEIFAVGMLVDSTPIVGITIVPVTIQKPFWEPVKRGDKHVILRVLLTNALRASDK
jgi:hypothetical protein